MSWLQSIILGLLQGVTELFPISSLGHTVILAHLLGWGQLATSDSFLPFLVLFHVGTASALFIFFWRDWVSIIRALAVTAVAGRVDADPNGRLAWLLVAGTVPAGLVGLFLETPLKHLFAIPSVAASFLVVNGVILLVGERIRRKALLVRKAAVPSRDGYATTSVSESTSSDAGTNLGPFSTLSLREAILVGLAQVLALIPGISRSGVTMVAAMRVGMSHEDAAAYTFLLATPIIGAAGLLELPQLAGNSTDTIVIAIVGGICAGVAAYLSVRFLMRYFETGRLDPFGYYCIVGGLASLALIAIGV
jgi:undecaprenyl-diphosphatase